MSEVDLTTNQEPQGGSPDVNNPPKNDDTDAGVKFPENWKDALEADIKDDPSMAAIKDIGNLAKSYVHAQRKMGADRIILPGKNSTEEDWSEVFRKLGAPDDPNKYELEGEFVDEQTASKLKETAHKLGILPKQLQGLTNFYNEIENSQKETYETSLAQKQKEEIDSLKQEWGDKFDVNLQRAQKALFAFADKDVIDHLKETGMSGDVKLVKLFSKIAGALDEDKFKFEADSILSSDKDSANKRISEIMDNKDHPYFNSSHPNHEIAVQEMNNWYKIASE